MTAVVRARALDMRFGDVRALDQVDLDIESGVTGVVGANGAGKSTLFKLILGLIEPTAGSVETLGMHPVRDGAEIAKEGKISGAAHASRGLLEFKIDPASPMHDSVFASGKQFVFYCGTGGRSALAAHRAIEMGLGKVVSMAGGFAAWKTAEGPTEPG